MTAEKEAALRLAVDTIAANLSRMNQLRQEVESYDQRVNARFIHARLSDADRDEQQRVDAFLFQEYQP